MSRVPLTTLTVAADGSSLDNPGSVGWARYADDDCWAVGGWESSANNRGEFTVALEFLRATEAVGLAGEEPLIQCDSQCVTNSLTRWRHGWKKRGRRKADGEPILNPDLVKDLDAALVGRTARFEWVCGRVGHPMNEAADSRARGAAITFRQGHPVSVGPGWTRGGQAPGNREAQQAPSAMSSSTPAALQTSALF